MMKILSHRACVPVLLSLVLFGVYLNTICPELYVGDSGEFAAAAFSLGVPHNSGYPLYSLLGKIFCMIPIGNVAFRMNLMSSCFAVLTVWLLYDLIFRMALSRAAAFSGALFLAFTPLFWQQTVCAEVYTLHAFFVVLLMRLLREWDEKRDFFRLLVFVFVTGLSFGNHMQTVVLAPAVFFFILSGDRRVLFRGKNLAWISCLFVLPLLIYLYLPIRTSAGAAIHWGDPNTLRNFLSHVTASAHREAYVLTMGPLDYLMRAKEALWFVSGQMGGFLLLSVWGWLRLPSARWRIFSAGIILFDFVYTVFFNIISLDTTPFNIPTLIVLSMLAGVGMAHILRSVGSLASLGGGLRGTVYTVFCALPVIPFLFHFGLCDQGRNYSAYEHCLNVFRTLDQGSILFLDGDNNLFPVIYGRIVERMREDVTLYDRYNIIYRMPYLGEDRKTFSFQGSWEELRTILEKGIIERRVKEGVYLAAFDPHMTVAPAGYRQIPYGILDRIVEVPADVAAEGTDAVWDSYVTESFEETFHRDYLNRQLCAYFYFRLGKHQIMKGRILPGLQFVRRASRIGYDDRMLHSDIGVFLVELGLFQEARKELETALIYHEDLSQVHSRWGYYHHRTRDYQRAAASFKKAVALDPGNPLYHKNLAFSLYEAGRREESILAFRRSLAIKSDQPDIERFMAEKGLTRTRSAPPAGE